MSGVLIYITDGSHGYM